MLHKLKSSTYTSTLTSHTIWGIQWILTVQYIAVYGIWHLQTLLYLTQIEVFSIYHYSNVSHKLRCSTTKVFINKKKRISCIWDKFSQIQKKTKHYKHYISFIICEYSYISQEIKSPDIRVLIYKIKNNLFETNTHPPPNGYIFQHMFVRNTSTNTSEGIYKIKNNLFETKISLQQQQKTSYIFQHMLVLL